MDLLAIAPAATEVAAGDSTITVRGLSLRAIPSLLTRFPDLLALLDGKQDIPVATLLAVMPDASNAIMAAGCGYLGNEQAEDVCDKLPLDCQVEMLTQIMALTFRQGVRPFVDRVSQVMLSLTPGEAPENQKGSSQTLESPSTA